MADFSVSLVAYHCVNEHRQMLWIIVFLFELFNLNHRINFYQSFLSSHIFNLLSLSLSHFLLFAFTLPNFSPFPLRVIRYRISFSYVTLAASTRPSPTCVHPYKFRPAFKSRNSFSSSIRIFESIRSKILTRPSFFFPPLPSTESFSFKGVEMLFDCGGSPTYVHIHPVYITVLRDYSKRCLFPTRFCTSHELFLPFLSPFIPLSFSRCPSLLSLSLSLPLIPPVDSLSRFSFGR